jgi:hypothetical protein
MSAERLYAPRDAVNRVPGFDPASHAHAREAFEPPTDPTLEWPPEDPGTAMGRLHLVAQVMSSGLWKRGETAPELAKAWGLSTSTVEDYSAEASRWLKALTDPDEVRQQLAYYLSKNLRIADGNPRSVAEVSKAYGPLVGLGDKGVTNNMWVDARSNTLTVHAQAAISTIVEQGISAALDAYELEPGDREGACEAGLAAAGRRLSGGVGQLVGGGGG